MVGETDSFFARMGNLLRWNDHRITLVSDFVDREIIRTLKFPILNLLRVKLPDKFSNHVKNKGFFYGGLSILLIWHRKESKSGLKTPKIGLWTKFEAFPNSDLWQIFGKSAILGCPSSWQMLRDGIILTGAAYWRIVQCSNAKPSHNGE